MPPKFTRHCHCFSRSLMALRNNKLIWCGLLVLVVVISIPLSLSIQDSDDESLILIHTMFRHGDRTPDSWSTYPNDPHKNVSYEPYGYGQLTKNGKQTMYSVGQVLRSAYSKFLGNSYRPELVLAKTTNFKRTKMSLQLVLASLFPPTLEDQIEPNLNWQPITYTYDIGQNEISDPFYFCLYYLHGYYNHLLSKGVQDLLLKYNQLYEVLTNYTGLNIKTPKNVCQIYLRFRAQKEFGLTLPGWTKKYYPDTLREQCYLEHNIYTGTNHLRKLSCGFLLKKIIEDTNAFVAGESSNKVKLFIYSVHDVNVVAMLKCLTVYYNHIPPYGATITIEVHRLPEPNRFGYKILYREQPHLPLQILSPFNCTEICPHDKFVEIVKENLPTKTDHCLNINEI